MPMGSLDIKIISPYFRASSKSIFMSRFNILNNVFWQIFCVLWLFYIITLMYIPCRMKLWHKQGIHVPEICFYNRPCHFLEAKRNEFLPYFIEKPPVMLLSSCKYLRNINLYIKSSEFFSLPST